ncbi:MAG: vWA domain-containing protein [Candidatus Omnitrophota bacterium]|nr:vWA domain-containing protein [Candidatus Omnitrophota bacterium]MDZ4241264.1 vWA domain-containing protein [Candidatus Omnitrophota bacterium]
MALDVALICDTTYSMRPYLELVRTKLDDIVKTVFSVVPNTRVGVIYFRDYDYADVTYVTQSCDLTNDIAAVRRFIMGVTSAERGRTDPEAVEEGLYAANQLSWRVGARRAVVLVGDAPPHGVLDSRSECAYGHFYLDEASSLAQKTIRIYAVHCGDNLATTGAFRKMADATQGKYLNLEAIDDLAQLLVAICMKEVGLLEVYKQQLRAMSQLTPSCQLLLGNLGTDD